jgi:hypothetical protein
VIRIISPRARNRSRRGLRESATSDYFAAKVIAAINSRPDIDGTSQRERVMCAYEVADLMLEEGSKSQ